MIFVRSQTEGWWQYKLDLFMDSPGFWEKQGRLLCSDWEDEISPSPDYYQEFQLTRL